MLLSTSYPLLDAFWTILIFTGFFLWIWVAVMVFVDLFRSPDMGGFHKALWVLGIFVLPLFGVLLYLLVRGHKMHEHAVQQAQESEQATRDYIRSVAGNSANGGGNGGGNGSHAVDELSRLASLRDSGVLSEQEFQVEKQKVLARS